MNFLDLYKKIRQLDEGLSQGNMMPQAISAPPSAPIGECGGMGECGGDMPMHHDAPKQQDSVSMNVTMNGQGAGGIRDLMNILRNIEDVVHDKEPEPHHEPHGDDDVIIGEPAEVEPAMLGSEEEEEFMGFAPEEESLDEEPAEEDYANRPDVRIKSVAAITDLGDDLSSKGKEAPKQAGGGNPWNVSESSIAAKLLKHYEDIKNRSMNEASYNDRNMPGYGDPETWGGRYPDGDGPSRGKNRGGDEEPDDYRIPGTGSQKDIEGDILDKWQKGFAHHQKTVKSEYVDQEGAAPNGEKYNKLFVIDAPNYVGAFREEDIFKRHNWGAKDVVDEVKKKDEHGRYLIILYIVDNHKYGHWKPFKDSVPKKPISFSK